MDDRRVGLIVRGLRRRRVWRQLDLALAAGVVQTTVSAIERGHVETLPLGTIRRILGALEASGAIEVRWRGGELDRLLDEWHAAIVGAAVEALRAEGWRVEVEVTYAHYGERGSIDVLAFHEATGSLLVIEVKSELTSLEETLRRHDEKVRHAPRIARQRFGWVAVAASRLLILPESTTTRRRIARHDAVLGAVLPVRGRAVRRWLARPSGELRGLLLLPCSAVHAGTRRTGGPHRVRRPRNAASDAPPRTDAPSMRPADPPRSG